MSEGFVVEVRDVPTSGVSGDMQPHYGKVTGSILDILLMDIPSWML